MRIRIPAQLLEQIVEHAKREAPRECCGLLGSKDGVVSSVYKTANYSDNELEFEMAAREIFDIQRDIEEAGESLAAVYHSHPSGSPVLSETDIKHARWWMVDWLVVGLETAEPDVRCYQVRNSFAQEIPVRVV